MKQHLRPGTLWLRSARAYEAGNVRLAKAIKFLVYLAFRCVLPYEVKLVAPVDLLHRGLGIVCHPRVQIGDDVSISHGVTIGAAGREMPPDVTRVTIGDGVFIGAAAVVLAPGGRSITIGPGARIGAHALVNFDVPPGGVVRGQAAEIVGFKGPYAPTGS